MKFDLNHLSLLSDLRPSYGGEAGLPFLSIQEQVGREGGERSAPVIGDEDLKTSAALAGGPHNGGPLTVIVI